MAAMSNQFLCPKSNPKIFYFGLGSEFGGGFWYTLANWYSDAAGTTQAPRLPGARDNVILRRTVIGNSLPVPVVRKATVLKSLNQTITVKTVAIFDPVGSTTFGLDSNAQLNGNAIFYGYGNNYGTIYGDVKFFDYSKNNATGFVDKSAEFYDNTFNEGYVGSDAYFYDSSAHDPAAGSIGGTGYFLDNSCITSEGFETYVPSSPPIC